MAPFTGFGEVPTHDSSLHSKSSPKIDVLADSCAARWLLKTYSWGSADFAPFWRNLSSFGAFLFPGKTWKNLEKSGKTWKNLENLEKSLLVHREWVGDPCRVHA